MSNIHIITGGSSGIGLECAKMFKDGQVLITGRSEDKLENAQKELQELGIDVIYQSSDISDSDSVDQLFEYAKSQGTIRTVINSAGVSGVGVDAKLTFDIDLLGTLNLINASLKYLDEGGILILISSMMGHVIPDSEDYNKLLTHPDEEGAIEKLIEIVEEDSDTAYNFSKKGVHLMVEEYASKFGEKGLRIVSVSPGIIMTPMAKKAAAEHKEEMDYMESVTPARRTGTPEDIAEAVRFLASDEASFITGTDLKVDGGLSLILPSLQE